MQSATDTGNTAPERVELSFKQPVLKLGSQGTAVKELQTFLQKLGLYAEALDGEFGEFTQMAVKKYQRQVFLPEDGIVGLQTWRSLYTDSPVDMPELQRGSQGDLVMRIQRRLKRSSDYIGYVDGDFGDITAAAVESLQRRHEILVTGIVDSQTWRALSKIIY
ncbi:peptidoglycan-binding domain-containing protein [Calothrix sp. 336/3]|uniref:peptidoglycan-binding domain-containing protein n=1 Tax=Calothrix sp. 336/3 TaxID=1337936 RepID=UPI0004E3C34A|nr:peptidoglycan-binding protein [Calothrix sp. 336/3]AKG22785.1 peptidoglycan-binding protein [Calothrix sp. 336/3]